jgi:hypothetical protein
MFLRLASRITLFCRETTPLSPVSLLRQAVTLLYAKIRQNKRQVRKALW